MFEFWIIINFVIKSKSKYFSWKWILEPIDFIVKIRKIALKFENLRGKIEHICSYVLKIYDTYFHIFQILELPFFKVKTWIWGDVWYAKIQEKLNTETDRQTWKINWQFYFFEFKEFELASIFWEFCQLSIFNIQWCQSIDYIF